MPLKNYGVLVGRPTDRRREDGTDTPHYQVRLEDADGVSYRIAVNVLSQESPSELLYLVEDDLRHPVADTAGALDLCWHALAPRAGLDLIRGNLVSRDRMRPLPPHVAGRAPERETVTLVNASPEPVDLTGWRIADRMKETCTVPAGPLAAGATLTVELNGRVALGNKGGTITLLERDGLKVSGVSYTAEQARSEGWTLTF
ncbi:MAG TPA: DUF2278 family protein [Solirubrobacteraceae bacterium]|jgi:hypothetical protein|nr:DUF2278 family protein [Solirubrobacteraceae bacterium]